VTRDPLTHWHLCSSVVARERAWKQQRDGGRRSWFIVAARRDGDDVGHVPKDDARLMSAARAVSSPSPTVHRRRRVPLCWFASHGQ